MDVPERSKPAGQVEDSSERRVVDSGKQYLTEVLDDEVAKSRATLEKEVLKFRLRLSSVRGELANESNQRPTFTTVR